MIDGLSTIIDYKVKGKIGLGCKAVRTSCYACDATGKKTITALKIGNAFRCSVCDSICSPTPAEREFAQATPYFIVPEEMKPILGDKPTRLRVVPARDEIERTFPTSYAKFIKNGNRFCSGDGIEAERYDTNKKGKIKVPCDPSTCPDALNKSCKPSGTFYFILVDVDAFSAYTVCPHSAQSIFNIMSELNKLRKSRGSNLIAQPICTLELVKKKKEDGSFYYVLQLFLPAVPLSALKSGQGALSYMPSNGNGEDHVDDASAIDIPVENESQKTADIPADEKARLEKGRERVKEKIKIYVKGQYVDRALEIYACEWYGVGTFEALSVANLLEIWHGINEKSEVVDKVWNLATKLRHGVGEELPLRKTA